MSTATIHRPTFSARPAHRPAHLPGQREPRSAPLRLVPPIERIGARPARVRSAVPAVQLTRRGRLVVLVVLLAAGVGMMIGLTGLFGSAAAGVAPASPATRTIVIQPGQTLWSIAGQVAPSTDRRDTIARIVELNALPNSAVSAGERIAVPTH
jgi:hypothetical protein